MKFQALVFDFNGVLWWDSELQEAAWQQFSKLLRGTPLSDEEMRDHVHGRNNRYTIEYLTGRPVTGDELEVLSEEKETLYRRLCLEQGQNFALSPGASQLLDFLVEQQIPHTIATASGKSNVDFFVEHLNLEGWFDISQILYDDDIRPGKPAPDIYRQAAQNLEIAPERCVVIEDSHSGIQAAAAAGIGCILALGPAVKQRELARLNRVYQVIENLHQVPRELFNKRVE